MPSPWPRAARRIQTPAPARWNFGGLAAWTARDGAGLVEYPAGSGALHLLGGWFGATGLRTNEHWYLAPGSAVWVQLADAPWTARHSHGCVVWQGRIYVVGGDANSGAYLPDVWSYDGAAWTRHDDMSFGDRVLHYVAAIESGANAGIYVMGGQHLPQFVAGPEAFYNDVWKATALGVFGVGGSDWTKILDPAPWSARGAICGSAVLNDEIYLLGGGTYDTPGFPGRNYYNTCYKTADGINWTALGAAPWTARQYHSVGVVGGLLYVAAGLTSIAPITLEVGDVWTSPSGLANAWTCQTPGQFMERHAPSFAARGAAGYLCGGTRQRTNDYLRDCWSR